MFGMRRWAQIYSAAQHAHFADAGHRVNALAWHGQKKKMGIEVMKCQAFSYPCSLSNAFHMHTATASWALIALFAVYD